MRCRARSGSFGFWHAPLAHDEKLRRVHFLARSLNKGVFDVPLRILFADDSMTAQNMGKKILSDAGYDVVAASNGAAAVKKIAEQKPDIIILDVYMPGYSGLEVCEKVRASLDTAKTPVLRNGFASLACSCSGAAGGKTAICYRGGRWSGR